ncbi:zf-HC2 domain-containing protein [Nonomuraea sp. NPDC050536]|uniref:zf-HC2 domain-containing protein n=1 Tax=Nonomuraea sp. NPDC050536 TaxID=3364366 RepID=UPI0037C85FAB
MISCRDYQPLLGMHALGRLPEVETVALFAHADGCHGCRAELDGLRAVAGALGHADPARVSPPPAPPPWLRESVLTAVGTRHAHRRRRRLAWAGGLVAAAIAVVTLLSGLSGVFNTDRPIVAYGSGGMRVSAELDVRPWGTAVDLSVSGLTTGQRYLVWLENRDGSRIPAGSFTARGMGLTMELSAAVQDDEAVALGLSTVPGGPAVLRAPISR